MSSLGSHKFAKQILLASLLLVTTLSGCTGSDEGGTEESEEDDTNIAPPAQVNDDSGGIEGIVYGPDQLPVADVSAYLNDDVTNVTTTDEAGRFSFSLLAPGDYIVNVQALRYKSQALTATVVAGETTSLEFNLVEQPVIGSHRKVIGPIPGKYFCGWSVVVSDAGVNQGGPCKALSGLPIDDEWDQLTEGEQNIFPFENVVSQYRVTPEDVLSTIVAEMQWQATSAAGETFRFRMEKINDRSVAGNGTNAATYGAVVGPSPLKFEVTPGVPHPNHNVSCTAPCNDNVMPQDATSFTIAVHPRTGEVASVYVEQNFEFYLTLFYNGAAPADYTVLET